MSTLDMQQYEDTYTTSSPPCGSMSTLETLEIDKQQTLDMQQYEDTYTTSSPPCTLETLEIDKAA